MALRRLASGPGSLLPDEFAWRLRYLRNQRRWPDLRNPKRFNEKVIWREVNDRRPILADLDDKLSAREIARTRVPGIGLPEVTWTGTEIGELRGRSLPERWVLKPNNSTHRIVFGAGNLDDERIAELAEETDDWLTRPVMWQSVTGARRPWVEANSGSALIIERFIGEGPDPPPDIKFFTFDGRVELILVRRGPEPGRKRAYFDRSWNRLDVNDSRGTSPTVEPPALRSELIETAEALSGGIDFVRVDLYESGDEILFGEFTPNPGWGLFRFEPQSFDLELGLKWKLPAPDSAAE